MLRQSVNRATTRYISAGAHAHASNANTAAQASQPRMRRPSGYEGTAIAARSRTVPHGLEAGLRIDISRGENIGRRHQKAGRRVWIADAEVEGLVALEDVLDLREGAVLVHDDVGVIAVVSVAGDDAGEPLAACTVDRLHPRLVSIPGDLDLVEAHPFDDAGIVGGVDSVHLEAGGFGHRLQERLPVLLL